MKLKNYRNMVPVLLIFLMAISSYMIVNKANKQEIQYLSYLQEARDKREERILTEALTAYEAAIQMSPDVELYQEVGEMLVELGNYKQQIEWGELMITDFPLNHNGYEYLMNRYLEEEKYAECYAIYEEARGRQTLTSALDEMIAGIEYAYTFDYRKYDEIGVFAGGYCAVQSGGLWGYISEKGNLKISEKYTEAGVFASNIAFVTDQEGERYFIDSGNNIKSYVNNDADVQFMGIVNENLYPVQAGEEYYFSNMDGELVLGPYQGISSYNFGKAAVLVEEGWIFIDTKGNRLTQDAYLSVKVDAKGIAFRNGRAFVETEEGIRMIDENFAFVGDMVFDDAIPFYESGDCYAAVKIGALWGFVDTTGKVRIDCQFAGADSFMNDYAAVCVRDYWGYIDKNGDIVIDTIFEQAAPFNASGCAMIREHGKWKLLKLTKYNW
ncbi:MAG: WG repeat-containing protein [Lachnospiraceae bacterium]